MNHAPKSVRSHRDLLIWQNSMELVENLYRLAARFPTSEQFRLTSQLLRAAISVPANIAEGHTRGSTRTYVYFPTIARGSLMETETFVTIAVRLRYLSNTEAEPVLSSITAISKMITAIQRKLRQRAQSQPTVEA